MHRFVRSLTAIAVLLAASAVLAESKPDSSGTRSKTQETRSAPRTLEAITIEGELDMPQVLFISARDQYRYMDHLHRRYQKDCAEIGREAQLPRRLELVSKER